MRTISAPMLPVSSGALPGQSSTTSGLSAPAAGQPTHNQATRETVAARRFMVAPLLSESGHWARAAVGSIEVIVLGARRRQASQAGRALHPGAGLPVVYRRLVRLEGWQRELEVHSQGV